MLKQNTQLKFVSLNTNQATTETTNSLITSLKWNLQNLNIGNKNKIALIRANGGVDTNLYFTFCPTIRQGDYSSINSTPLIYSGIGNNNGNITAKNYYTISGNNFNELELKNYVATPQNDFTYPELDGLAPIIWYKFDDSGNIGLDTMENATMTQEGTTALPTYDTVSKIAGSGSVKFAQAQTMLKSSYNFDHITTEMTITFWIKIISYSSYGGYDSILINPQDQTKFYIYRSGSTSNFGICIFGSGYLEGIFFNGLFTGDNTWRHFTITAEKSGTKTKINSYINGVFNATYTTGTWSPLGILSLKMGHGSLSFIGNLDDMRFYNKVLTQDQISQLYNGRRLDYPIIKNEAYLPANSTANDPNIHTIPNLWCRFETGALTVNDGTENANLTNNGGATNANVSVRGNNSISLNGSTQYLSGNLNVGKKSWSIATWLYPRANDINGCVVCFGNILSANQQVSVGRGLNHTSCYAHNCLADEGYTDPYPNDINTWVHIVWTYDAITRKKAIFRNGIKQILTGADYATLEPTLTTYLAIGVLTNAAYNYNGNIDDLRIYVDKVLTQEEITRIYTGARTDYTINILPNSTNDLNINTKPNLWCKFETGALLTNDGTENANLTNNGATNAGISVRGNNSVSFNGTNQDITGSLNINNGSFTISLWTYIKAIGTGFHFFTFGNSASYNGLFYLAFRTTTRYEIGVYGIYGNTTTEVFANEVNNWVHLVITFDINTSAFYIYRNGVKLTNQYTILAVPLAINSNFQIGSMMSSGNWYNGYIDDFRVYKNKVLTVDEINRIYLNSKADYTTISEPLIGQDLSPNVWLKFDTGALTTNSGTDAITLTNNGGTNAGVAIRGNNSLSLNGSTQYLTGTIEGIANNSWSISVWLYTKASGGYYLCIGNNQVINEILILIYNQTGTSYTYGIAYYGNDSFTTSAFPNEFNNWVHIVATYNLNTRERSIYRNGVKLSVSNSLSLPLNCNNILTIGKYAAGATNFYNGYIDDLRIYTGIVLSQAQITELYQNNTFYKFPTAETKYIGTSASTGITYNFELENEDEKIISHY